MKGIPITGAAEILTSIIHSVLKIYTHFRKECTACSYIHGWTKVNVARSSVAD
jgi:hypothetical protein